MGGAPRKPPTFFVGEGDVVGKAGFDEGLDDLVAAVERCPVHRRPAIDVYRPAVGTGAAETRTGWGRHEGVSKAAAGVALRSMAKGPELLPLTACLVLHLSECGMAQDYMH